MRFSQSFGLMCSSPSNYRPLPALPPHLLFFGRLHNKNWIGLPLHASTRPAIFFYRFTSLTSTFTTGLNFRELTDKVAWLFELEGGELKRPNKMPQRAKVRSILCYRGSYESLGRRHGDSRCQGMTHSAINEATWWGKEFSVNTNKSRMIGIHYFKTIILDVRQLPKIYALWSGA
jgi:hypothetical protein